MLASSKEKEKESSTQGPQENPITSPQQCGVYTAIHLDLNLCREDFPGGPMLMNPPSNVGDAGGISTQGTQIPHATWKLNSFATNREKPVH